MNNFDIIIPTRDSAAWLSSILEWYKNYKVSPLFIVDSRTKDKTREIIQEFDFKFNEFLPRGDYPEAGMLEFGAKSSTYDWILRLDDDELPNPDLLRWVKEVGVNSKNQCWFISRRELYNSNGQVLYSRSYGKYPLAAHPNQLHPMLRLYNRKRVQFHEELHTSGLKEVMLYGFAPENCFITHLNCLLHSPEERLKKIKHYENIKPESTWQLADEYLPELFSEKYHRADNQDLDVFSPVINKIQQKNKSVLNILDSDSMLARAKVKERARHLFKKKNELKFNKISKNIHYTADDVAWIEFAPKFIRRPIAKFICTLLPENNTEFCGALWNYLDLIELDSQIDKKHQTNK